MDWGRVNVWTSTFYTLLHSLALARRIGFGNLTLLDEYAREATGWTALDCSYQSALLLHSGGDDKIVFRRDPNVHFQSISNELVRMLIQDLVRIMDEMLGEVLTLRKMDIGQFPQTKLIQLQPYLSKKTAWSYHGCLELVACRNVFSHSNGVWTQKSIDIISEFIEPNPSPGDRLIIGISMLFRFRKAVRTFLNEVSKDFRQTIPKAPRKPTKAALRRAAARRQKAELKRRRKALVLERLQPGANGQSSG